MKAEQEILKAINKKGWKVLDIKYERVFYGREGREGGWYIVINEEDCNDECYNEVQKIINKSYKNGEFQGCCIVAYNKEAVLEIIKDIPEFKPLISKYL